MYEIEQAQEKYLQDKDLSLVLGVQEFMRSKPPAWLSIKKAQELIMEMRNISLDEIEQFDTFYDEFNMSRADTSFYDEYGYSRDDYLELLKYKVADQIWQRYGVEEEHLQKIQYLTQQK